MGQLTEELLGPGLGGMLTGRLDDWYEAALELHQDIWTPLVAPHCQSFLGGSVWGQPGTLCSPLGGS